MAKAVSLIAEAAAAGARLIAFPEILRAGISALGFVQAPIKNHEYFKSSPPSIEVPGPETQQLCEAARESRIFVSIGISERSPASVGCLWNSNLLIGADGTILTHHRKLVPTFYEKLIWANGDGEGLVVRDTEIGKLGMLICGENTNPLARYALIAQGEQIHVSSYPPVWPTRPPNEPGRYDLAAPSGSAPALIRLRARCSTSFLRRSWTNRPWKRCAASIRMRSQTLDKARRPCRWWWDRCGEVISDTLCEVRRPALSRGRHFAVRRAQAIS